MTTKKAQTSMQPSTCSSNVEIHHFGMLGQGCCVTYRQYKSSNIQYCTTVLLVDSTTVQSEKLSKPHLAYRWLKTIQSCGSQSMHKSDSIREVVCLAIAVAYVIRKCMEQKGTPC